MNSEARLSWRETVSILLLATCILAQTVLALLISWLPPSESLEKELQFKLLLYPPLAIGFASYYLTDKNLLLALAKGLEYGAYVWASLALMRLVF